MPHTRSTVAWRRCVCLRAVWGAEAQHVQGVHEGGRGRVSSGVDIFVHDRRAGKTYFQGGYCRAMHLQCGRPLYSAVDLYSAVGTVLGAQTSPRVGQISFLFHYLDLFG